MDGDVVLYITPFVTRRIAENTQRKTGYQFKTEQYLGAKTLGFYIKNTFCNAENHRGLRRESQRKAYKNSAVLCVFSALQKALQKLQKGDQLRHAI